MIELKWFIQYQYLRESFKCLDVISFIIKDRVKIIIQYQYRRQSLKCIGGIGFIAEDKVKMVNSVWILKREFEMPRCFWFKWN